MIGTKAVVGIGCDGDGTDVLGFQDIRDQNRGRTVGCADDSDRCRIADVEADGARDDDGDEDSDWARPRKNQFRIGKQRAEVNRGADADEDSNGKRVLPSRGQNYRESESRRAPVRRRSF